MKVVLFSGGKDSLVALHLALQENPNIPVLFNDTRDEFPETIQYIDDLAADWGLNFHVTYPKTTLNALLKRYGLSTYTKRRCSLQLKIIPTKEWLKKQGENPKYCLFITGRRHCKHLTSMKTMAGKSYNPVWNWTDEQVWSYIKKHDLPVNPLYAKMKRVGCMHCIVRM